MKKIFLVAVSIVLFSCSKDDTITANTEPTVYVVGSEYDGTNNIAKLWKNGVATNLTDGSQNASARSVYVSGNDVYVVGSEYNGTNSKYNGTNSVVKLWKNGVATALTDGSHNAYANAIFVSGNDVYVAGYEYNSNDLGVAKLWKNGVAIDLTDGAQSASAYSVFVTRLALSP